MVLGGSLTIYKFTTQYFSNVGSSLHVKYFEQLSNEFTRNTKVVILKNSPNTRNEQDTCQIPHHQSSTSTARGQD